MCTEFGFECWISLLNNSSIKLYIKTKIRMDSRQFSSTIVSTNYVIE